MKSLRIPILAAVSAFLASAATAGAISLQISPNSTTALPVGSGAVEADYSTSHLYVDEINGDSIPITIFFNPGTTGVDEAEVYTDLNNRDQVNNTSGNGNVPNVMGSSGVPYGIIPPNGAYIVVGSSNCYYSAYQMQLVNGGYQITLSATATGAYRITARYHLTSDPALTGSGPNTWHYYGDFSNGSGYNYRDAAIVVSPKKATQMTMEEVNAMYVDANAPANDNDYSTRSTFDDLDGGPNATTGRPYSVNFARGLGINWLWLQPIHPIGIVGRVTDANEGNASASVGSPYSIKNYFAINSLFSKTFVPGTTSETTGRANALAEFQRFVSAADTAGLNIMLDVAFNHTAFDAELGPEGQTLFGNVNTSATTQFWNTQANVYSRWNGGSADQTNSANYGSFDYGARAYNSSSIAQAVDRFDFGKYVDCHDIYFGNYSALVDLNDSNVTTDSGNYNYSQTDWEKYLNEADSMDYTIGTGGVSNDALDAQWNSSNGHFDSVTQNMWKYFAAYIPYWLQQTGHTDAYGNLVGNSTLADPVARRAQDDLGIDGVRADFAQGLPPQLWEYMINYARSYKWDFVFLCESLDGNITINGSPQHGVSYRSGRHFDLINENVLFALYQAQYSSDFRSIFDARRAAYGYAMILWDTESHDEAGYADPFQALARYAVDATIDGVPEMFYGQEIGISGAVTPPNAYTYGTVGQPGGSYGFSNYLVDFGKPVPNFEIYNSMGPAWDALGNANTYGHEQLYPVYSGIGNARINSPALQSANRYYLNNTAGNVSPNIWAVAKYQTANAYPNTADVVFAFVNLLPVSDSNSQTDTFNVNITQNGSNLFGIDPARTYNVKNISADNKYSSRSTEFLWGAGITGANVLANGVYVGLNGVPQTDPAGWESAPYEAQYLKLYDVTPPPAPGAPATAKAYAIGSSATFNWAAGTDPEGGTPSYSVVVSTAPNGGGTVIYTGTVTSPTVTVTGAYGQTLYAKVTQINAAGISGNSASQSAAGTMLLDPNGDYNGTGLTNEQQDWAGFNPLITNYYFHITSISQVPTGQQITWTSIPGRSYVVQASSSSPTSGFTTMPGTVTAAGTSSSYIDTTPNGTTKFYRVLAQ